MSEYLALRDGARGFRQGFSGPVLLRIPTGRFACVYRTITFFGAAFQTASSSLVDPVLGSYNPVAAVTATVWAVSLSLATTQEIARTTSRACCFLFLRVLRCFSSPGWPRWGYVFTPG